MSTAAVQEETTATGAPARRRLLVVDDDPLTTKLLRMVFEQQRFDVYCAESGNEALELAERHQPEVAILDLRLPDMDGITLLEKLRALPHVPVAIMLTAHGDVSTAVRAMQLGARHYLPKPVNRDELLITVQRALEHGSLVSEVQDLRRRARPGLTLAEQMGPGPEVRQVAERVSLVAASDLTVLIQGETGAGKELIAQAIHRESNRAARPFIAVDCGAIPETLLESELFGHEKGAFTGADKKRLGQFQLAEGGTLFLDEIGNLPQSLHAKLLRALESREVAPVGGTRRTALDIRFVAATNFDLEARVREGAFREDLYFRLAQYTIALPALRERTGDIPHLVRRFQAEACQEMRRPVVDITPEALALLQRHAWPGNVRELRNVIRQAVLHARDMTIDETLIRSVMRAPLPRGSPAAPAASDGRSLREVSEAAVRDAEIAAIRAALQAAGGNKAAAAKALQTDYKTLHVKIQRYGIRAADYKKD
jgi:DNA-binding NtrC family response regulator